MSNEMRRGHLSDATPRDVYLKVAEAANRAAKGARELCEAINELTLHVNGFGNDDEDRNR